MVYREGQPLEPIERTCTESRRINFQCEDIPDHLKNDEEKKKRKKERGVCEKIGSINMKQNSYYLLHSICSKTEFVIKTACY